MFSYGCLRADSVLIMNDWPHEITGASVPRGSSGISGATETILLRSTTSIGSWPFCSAGVLLASRFSTINCQIVSGRSVLRWKSWGVYTAHAEHTSVLYSFSFLPLFVWRFDVALTSHRLRPAAEAGALWGLSALGGYPAIVILSGGMLFLWGLGRCCSASSAEPAMM